MRGSFPTDVAIVLTVTSPWVTPAKGRDTKSRPHTSYEYLQTLEPVKFDHVVYLDRRESASWTI
jgi:hypothetical protein